MGAWSANIAGSDLTSCQNYAESLVAKLRVVFEHKSKMEKMFNSKRIASQGKMKAAEVMWRSCEENLTLVAAQLSDCQNSRGGQIARPSNADLAKLQAEIATLKAVNASLSEVVLRKEEAMQSCSKEMLRLRKSLSSCEDMMKKYVGVSSIMHLIIRFGQRFKQKKPHNGKFIEARYIITNHLRLVLVLEINSKA
ncbi:hypothetical protein ANCCAN_20800 [Ancylostoma caninum]|uniref:Uncharacterized protein n=1 Tax=Ancylostoma caninum TaxID=29170 RepID=A0A368FMT1_ANCCA|nr:hypothetical protein ANCCAN_20800 [Ancylostoma caninum]